MQPYKILIAFDLDGTILTANRLSKRTIRILKKASENGCLLAAITGRPEHLMPEAILSLPCIRYVASASGAKIWDRETNEVLGNYFIKKESAEAIVRLITKRKVGLMLSFDDKQVLDIGGLMMFFRKAATSDLGKASRDKFKSLAWLKMFIKLRLIINAKKYLAKTQSSLIKAEIFCRDGHVCDQVMGDLELFEDIEAVPVGFCNIELTARYATKGEVLRTLCQRHNLDKNQVIAFGDGGNDVSMRSAAGTLVAMENGSEQIKALADFIAPAVHIDGVAHTLSYLGLSGKENFNEK